MTRRGLRPLLAFLALLWLIPAAADVPPWAQQGDASGLPPRIALIIDDLGGRRAAGERVIALPGPVACSFLPYATHTPMLARQAHRAGKEVMLHLPMQAVEPRPLDAGGLTLDMNRRLFLQTLNDDLARVPHLAGINNHMGSLLTRHPGHMRWLMEALRRQPGLFFVDSRTSRASVARRLAFEHGIPSLSRDVFLDAEPGGEAVRGQFRRLLQRARRQGFAVGIGHPYPDTLKALETLLPALAAEGVRLVPVSELVERQYARDSAWRLSLYH
ncbi:divergent polysaccharide deacetylase family protein [Thiohalobacter sp. IOR34]|uniref:divergent polysaccharide deacetylase family protein n=1 Tax=Thiohalobacter sp. IOR34 TaxID=3057176 RepID=UPI0025B0CBA9|nr:divergent polysaccharide deacetylase family protein [Thiohalobacter sp. IOR34]WJW75552.1 divergent polysaccharide deacetylase family protein [Thiohalobacter sp. IOR34]